MTLVEREDDSIVTLEVRGRLTAETLEPFQQAVARRLNDSSSEFNVAGFIVDLEHVDYIDSEGLGSLIQAYTSCKRRGKQIVFVHVFGRNLQLLKTTKLLTVFEIYDTLRDAERAASAMTSAAFSATM